ncbi:Alpha-ketoglutarate-dependent sulfate ester dioxygenase [Diplonema papillatum]|nr:Alpha-ketoglutarate-dependent sulfate ester dioxygenase [Diplonema papillatum]
MATCAAAGHGFYQLEPIREEISFGARITGIDLKSVDLSDELIDAIKQDMTTYSLLLFKDQGKVSGQRQVDISKRLGRVESTFYKHPRSPHPDVFRVSNDAAEGCTNVGRTGWHVDGTFQSSPFKYQTMHFHSVCAGGDTQFIPLRKVYEGQPEATRKRWDDLWMVTDSGTAHPLVYKHPARGDVTMMFHCGPSFVSVWLEKSTGKLIPGPEVARELTKACEETLAACGITVQWEAGDFAINDNLGNAHYATPGTQRDAKSAGLRVLHRTTIAGEQIPVKHNGEASFRLQ